ncbi:MAG TPA: DNA translocase FtsK 4TM domain-containing protein [Myxococcota bacterium]|nr:DNA translocase FtsK 4TM domain-containing protein [Myxococcota bacterium]
MARAGTRRRRSGSSRTGGDSPLGRFAAESFGLVLIALAALAALALATYTPSDPLFRLTAVANGAGAVGATLAGLLRRSTGWGGAVLVAVAVVVGGRLLLGRGAPRARFWTGAALLLVSLATFPSLLHAVAGRGFADEGSVLGVWLCSVERMLLSLWGALLLNLLCATAGALAVLGIPTGSALRVANAVARRIARGLVAASVAIAGAARVALGAIGAALARTGAAAASGAVRLRAALRRSWQSLAVRRAQRARRAEAAAASAQTAREATEPAMAAEEAIPAEIPAPVLPAASLPQRAARRGDREEPHIVDHRGERKSKAPEQEAFVFAERTPQGPYEFPDLSIFQRPPEVGRSYDRDSLIMNSRILEKKLADFGVLGRVVTVHPGPVITMYEFEPGSGVKVNRITNLADDLALALRALSVRIIAPLPGKSVVGIEIPNPERDIVYIRDLLESENFRKSRSKLTLALGKDIFGNPVEADLAKMPHLLVAGATGTGKSVFLNSLLCSILFRASPADLKLLLIDPKILELSIYEGIPHLIADVVTNPKRAAAALAGIVAKMEERYRMMAALGVRNIEQFNERVDERLADGHTALRLRPRPGEEEAVEVPLQRIPYIVVVIDELADLMVVSARDVEEALQRLAQMARAAGIHLVLATQRPSVDVLTGVIKANFPSRISFQVSSRTDSRTIMDQNGAEHLLGQGDMLYLPPGTSKLQRIHGAYVSEKEVGELVAFLRQQGAPQFDETLLRARQESEQKEERGEDVDDLYDRAIEIVAETRNASISYIQRRLKVGYNRAARMIEQMENEGIVGPQDGPKPREVFVRPIEAE